MTSVKDAINKYATGLQHIGIPTKDMQATTDFYTKLGFGLKGQFMNGDVTVKFFEFKGLVLETWEEENVNPVAGAINHISLDTPDADALFAALQGSDLNFVNTEVQHLPFWEKGIKFFNILGPNGETIEFCEIVK